MDARSLNELLECSVCLEQLDATSRVLPCQHTFCRRCLDEIVATKSALCCPECRCAVTIPVRDLPTNILLVRLLEGIKNSKRGVGSGGTAASAVPLANSCGAGDVPTAAGCHVRAARASPKTISTSQPCAKALYNYDAKEPGDLSFKKNDMVLLRKQVDENWYHGELLDGHQGFFPATYVQVITPLPQDIPKCKALYDFLLSDNNEKDCLTFQRDETITVIRRVDNNWAEGKLADRIGIFPISFVEMNDSAKWLVNAHANLNVQTSRNTTTTSESAAAAATVSTTTITPSTSTTSATTSFSSASTAADAATKRHSMTASLSPSSDMPPAGGVATTSAQQRHSMELTGHTSVTSAGRPSSTEAPVRLTAAVSSPRTTAQVAGAMSSSTTGTASPQRAPASVYVALYSYKPQKPDEVELKKGDYYTICDRCHDGWFKGTCLRSGAVGVFPGNYVQPIKLNGTSKVSGGQIESRGTSTTTTTTTTTVPLTSTTTTSSSHAVPAPSSRNAQSDTANLQTATVITSAVRSRPSTCGQTDSTAGVSRAHSFPRTCPTATATAAVSDGHHGRSRRPPHIKVPAHVSRHPVDRSTRNGTRDDEPKCETESSATAASAVPVPVATASAAASNGTSRDKDKKERREKDALRVGLMKRLSSVGIAGKNRKSRSATTTTETVEGATGCTAPGTAAATANVHQRTTSMPITTPPADATGGSASPQPGASGSTTTTQTATTSKPSKTKPLVRERYRCIMPYPPHSDIELELKVGDVVFVHKRRDDGWYKGTLQRTGKTGLFPGSFVKSF